MAKESDFITFTEFGTNNVVMVAVRQIRLVRDMPNGALIEFGPGHVVQVTASLDEVERALGMPI